jgi:DNA replicative helicase MCM subunit Mcm2 (Cdc46/Mcm family)
MSPPKEVDLIPEEQAILREWRELFVEHYTEDIKGLQGHHDNVYGFEVDHLLIDQKDRLRLDFHTMPTRVLELGTRVLREQFEHHLVQMRPVIRVVGFPENYLRSVDSLRMRDRSSLVSLNVKINDVSPAYGWLKTTVYECRGCGTRIEVEQRRARERESPGPCRICIQKLIEDGKEEEITRRLFADFTEYKFLQEECNYEDLQDVSMSQVAYNSDLHVLNCSTKVQIVGTVVDDLVGDVEPQSYARVNGIVRVQPIPDRTFAKDTRRTLSLDVLSVEPLALHE